MLSRTIALCVLAIVFAQPASAVSGERTLRVLFVGNSLTYINDLPATFAAIYEAAEPGTRVETEMLAQGGYLLREHLDAGALQSLLGRKQFDVVVLQELGGLPLCPPDFPPCKDSPQALRDTVALVRAANSRPIWFSTWQQAPSAQKELSLRVSRLARDLQIDTADVGAAIQRAAPGVRRHLLIADGHPQPLGSWLAAAALVASVNGRPLPEAVPPASCGSTWPRLSATQPASQQESRPAACYRPSTAQWRNLRAAIRVDGQRTREKN